MLAGATAAGAERRAEITTTPVLEPSFSPAVHDYTIRCDGDPVQLAVRTARAMTAKLAGRPGRSRSIDAAVAGSPNQAFSVSLRRDGETKRYHVRCLPPGFPEWHFHSLRGSEHPFYAITLGEFVVVFDKHGVPVWWWDADAYTFDAKVLDSGRVASASLNGGTAFSSHGYRIQDLDGKVHRVVSAVGDDTDIHDLQRLSNGHFLVLAYQPRAHVDLTAYGGSEDDTVLDAVIQEIDRKGRLVWSWNSKDHLGLEETGRWWDQALQDTPRDIVHVNSVEPDGSKAFLISMRHTDAVYRIRKRTGNVAWKLGGTTTPQSLEVLNDPHMGHPLGGQHDARRQADGTITVHDNGTNLDRAPRAVRYRVDPEAGTATLVEEVDDPAAQQSFCCGSARRDPGGSWLMSWGGVPLVTEFDPKGRRTFRLSFEDGVFSYRAVAAPDGALRIGQLRRGMTAMHGRPDAR